MGLIASTEIQKRKVEEICKEILYVTSDGDGVRIDDVITFDEMAEIVDYIRTTNITNEQ